MLAYYPEINAGITTQSNHAQFNSNVAFELAAAFFKDDDGRRKRRGTGAVGGGRVRSLRKLRPQGLRRTRRAVRAGRDRPTSSSPSRARATPSTCRRRASSGFEIVPTSDSTFRLLAVEASVTFLRGEDGEVEGAILHQNGANQPATRLEGRSSLRSGRRRLKISPDYAGRFYSEELETFYTIVRGRRGTGHAPAKAR